MSVIGFSNGLTKEQSIEKFKKQFINEYHDIKGYKNNYYSALWNLQASRTEYLDKILDNLFQNYDRISFESKSNADITYGMYKEEYNLIQEFLKEYEYEVTDFIGGFAMKGNRKFKIGKLLERHKAPSDLVKMFSNSIYRVNSKKNNIFTLSRNVYDILTMSTFKGWSSCMSLARDNFTHVPVDIQYGTLIVYNHSPFDTEIEKPSGRFLLKPFIYEKDGKLSIFYKRENTRYGELDTCWRDIGDEIEKYVNDILIDGSSSTVGISPAGIYRDDISSTSISVNFEKIDPLTVNFHEDSSMIRKYMEYLQCHDIAMYNPNLIDYTNIEKLTSISLLSKLEYSGMNKVLENNSASNYYNKIIDNLDISKINVLNLTKILPYLARDDDKEALLKFMEVNIPSRLVVASIIGNVDLVNKRIKDLIDSSFVESNYYILNSIFRNMRIDKDVYIHKLIQDKINQSIDLNLYGLYRNNFDKTFIEVKLNPAYILYEYSRLPHSEEMLGMLSKHFGIPKSNISSVSSELRNIIRANKFIGKDYKVIVDDKIFEIKGDI